MYGKDGAFWCLNLGMWLFALGNGTCEAVINPLTATLFPQEQDALAEHPARRAGPAG